MMFVDAIREITAAGCAAYTPPLSDYALVSQVWKESEFHCLDLGAASVRVGFWSGEPGSVALHPWPYTEVCVLISGRVAVVDMAGGRKEFGSSQGFIIPKGFFGTWETLEPACKVYVAIS